MKNLLTSLFVFMLALPTFAQDDYSVPLLEVEGYSERKVAPDEAVFHINLEEKTMKVADAVRSLNVKTEALAASLKKAKIKDYKLVADNYSVDINRVYRGGTSRDSGYVARQNLMIITNSKNADLQKIVEAIQNSGDMSFNLSFRVSEATQKSLEDELLAEALKNAESRAILISQTLNIKNIRVHRVALSTQHIPIVYGKMEMVRASADAYEPATMIEPDDQKLTKRVTVKYTY